MKMNKKGCSHLIRADVYVSVVDPIWLIMKKLNTREITFDVWIRESSSSLEDVTS